MHPNNFNKTRHVDAAKDGSNLSDMENIPDIKSALLDLLHVDAIEDDGNPLFITDLDPLLCQNNGCSNPLKVPIRQCLSGHLFCSDCHEGHLNCMLCLDNELFPAPSVDAILNSIMDVCPNKIRGCNEKFPFYEFDDHVEEHCKCSHLTCPMPRCFEPFDTRYQLESHLTRNHKTHVDSFTFGVPAHFAFEMHSDTRILIESKTHHIFVVHYKVGGDTLFKFFCVDFCDGPQFTYRITDQMGVTLLADNSVPVTTFKEGAGAVGWGGSLPHQLRTGEFNYLYCNFVITIKRVP